MPEKLEYEEEATAVKEKRSKKKQGKPGEPIGETGE